MQRFIPSACAFCGATLRRCVWGPPRGRTKDFAIYDETEQQAPGEADHAALGVDDKQLTPRIVLSRISWAKNHMLDPQEYLSALHRPESERIAHLMTSTTRSWSRANALDFDDLLLEAVRLLSAVAAVRSYYNRRFRYC